MSLRVKIAFTCLLLGAIVGGSVDLLYIGYGALFGVSVGIVLAEFLGGLFRFW